MIVKVSIVHVLTECCKDIAYFSVFGGIYPFVYISQHELNTLNRIVLPCYKRVKAIN